MPTARTILSALILVLAMSSPAMASREATPDELQQMAAALSTDARCIIVTVSTVNPAIAAVEIPSRPACPVGSGYLILERDGDGWHYSFAGSAGERCQAWQHTIGSRVALDLGVCARPRPRWYIPCGDSRGTEVVTLRTRPRACNNADRESSNATTWILKRLRWSTWGGKVARARGLKFYAKRYPGYSGRPVRVRAFRVSRMCGLDQQFYTRLRFTLPRWIMRSRPFGGGPWSHRRMPRVSYVVKAARPDC